MKFLHFTSCEIKATPVPAWTGPQASRRLRLPEYLEKSAREGGKVSPQHRPLLPLPPPGDIPGIHFFSRLNGPWGHNAATRIKSMKNSSDAIGNRTRVLPGCIAVPQPTAPPRAQRYLLASFKELQKCKFGCAQSSQT